jgi:hypothetical protein
MLRSGQKRAVEASAGKMLRSGQKRAVEEDEEQAAKPVARPKVENEEESTDATNVARREQGEGERDENADESEVYRDDHKDIVDEDWLDEKPPAKSAKITTPKRRRSPKCLR